MSPTPRLPGRPLALAAAALLAVGAAGCDANESLLGEFVGTVDVVSALPVEGEAIYTVVATEDGPRFVLGLFVGDLGDNDYDDYAFIAFTREGGRPGVGAYSVDEDTDAPSVVAATLADVEDGDDPLDATGYVLRGRTGVLSITGADAYGNLAGSFQFEAEGASVRAPEVALSGRASGRFEAYYEPPSVFAALGLDLGQ